MRALQSRKKHLQIYVCLFKVSLSFSRGFDGTDFKTFFAKDACIASTKEQEILENNLRMMEVAFYTWKHLYTFPLLGSLTIAM